MPLYLYEANRNETIKWSFGDKVRASPYSLRSVGEVLGGTAGRRGTRRGGLYFSDGIRALLVVIDVLPEKYGDHIPQ
jgi:hypothetical protein